MPKAEIPTLGREAIARIQKTPSALPVMAERSLGLVAQEFEIMSISLKSAGVGSAKDFLRATVSDPNRTALEEQLRGILIISSCFPETRIAVLTAVLESATMFRADSMEMLRAAEILAVIDPDQIISRAWAGKFDNGKLGNDKFNGLQTVTLLAKTALEYSLLDSSQETEIAKATGERLWSSRMTQGEISREYGKTILGFVGAAVDRKLINEEGLTPKQAVELITVASKNVSAGDCLSVLANLNNEESKTGVMAIIQENPELEEQTLSILKRMLIAHSTFSGISPADYKDLANVLQLLPEGKTETAQAVLAGMIGITNKNIYTIEEKKELPPQIKEFLDASLSYLGTTIKLTGVVDGFIIKAYFDLLPKLSTYRGYPIADYFRENIKPGLEKYLLGTEKEVFLTVLTVLRGDEKEVLGFFELIAREKPELLWEKENSDKPFWYSFLSDGEDDQKIIDIMMDLCQDEKCLELFTTLNPHYPELAMKVFTRVGYLSAEQIETAGDNLEAIATVTPIAVVSRARMLVNMPVEKNLMENAANSLCAKIQKRGYLEKEEFAAIRELTPELFHKVGVAILADSKISMLSRTQLILENQQLLPDCQTDELERILRSGAFPISTGVEIILIEKLSAERNFQEIIKVHKNRLVRHPTVAIQGLLKVYTDELPPIEKEIKEIINNWVENMDFYRQDGLQSEEVETAHEILDQNLINISIKRRKILMRLLKTTEGNTK